MHGLSPEVACTGGRGQAFGFCQPQSAYQLVRVSFVHDLRFLKHAA